MRKLLAILLIIVAGAEAANKTTDSQFVYDTAFVSRQFDGLRAEIRGVRDAHLASPEPPKQWIAQRATYWGLEDWFMDGLSFLLLVANVILIYAVRRQLFWMRRTVEHGEREGKSRDAADLERQSFEKSRLRARLNLEVTVASVVINPTNASALVQVNPIIKNVGETAAETIAFLPRMFPNEYNDVPRIKALIQEDIAHGHSATPGPLYTDIVVNSPRTLRAGERAANIEGQWNGIRRDGFDPNNPDISRGFFLYAGLIKYRDIFNNIWVRQFIWHIIFKPNVVAEVLVVVEAFNEETLDDKWPKDV